MSNKIILFMFFSIFFTLNFSEKKANDFITISSDLKFEKKIIEEEHKLLNFSFKKNIVKTIKNKNKDSIPNYLIKILTTNIFFSNKIKSLFYKTSIFKTIIHRYKKRVLLI